jgi:hypothetical protein
VIVSKKARKVGYTLNVALQAEPLCSCLCKERKAIGCCLVSLLQHSGCNSRAGVPDLAGCGRRQPWWGVLPRAAPQRPPCHSRWVSKIISSSKICWVLVLPVCVSRRFTVSIAELGQGFCSSLQVVATTHKRVQPIVSVSGTSFASAALPNHNTPAGLGRWCDSGQGKCRRR